MTTKLEQRNVSAASSCSTGVVAVGRTWNLPSALVLNGAYRCGVFDLRDSIADLAYVSPV